MHPTTASMEYVCSLIVAVRLLTPRQDQRTRSRFSHLFDRSYAPLRSGLSVYTDSSRNVDSILERFDSVHKSGNLGDHSPRLSAPWSRGAVSPTVRGRPRESSPDSDDSNEDLPTPTSGKFRPFDLPYIYGWWHQDMLATPDSQTGAAPAAHPVMSFVDPEDEIVPRPSNWKNHGEVLEPSLVDDSDEYLPHAPNGRLLSIPITAPITVREARSTIDLVIQAPVARYSVDYLSDDVDFAVTSLQHLEGCPAWAAEAFSLSSDEAWAGKSQQRGATLPPELEKREAPEHRFASVSRPEAIDVGMLSSAEAAKFQPEKEIIDQVLGSSMLWGVESDDVNTPFTGLSPEYRDDGRFAIEIADSFLWSSFQTTQVAPSPPPRCTQGCGAVPSNSRYQGLSQMEEQYIRAHYPRSHSGHAGAGLGLDMDCEDDILQGSLTHYDVSSGDDLVHVDLDTDDLAVAHESSEQGHTAQVLNRSPCATLNLDGPLELLHNIWQGSYLFDPIESDSLAHSRPGSDFTGSLSSLVSYKSQAESESMDIVEDKGSQGSLASTTLDVLLSTVDGDTIMGEVEDGHSLTRLVRSLSVIDFGQLLFMDGGMDEPPPIPLAFPSCARAFGETFIGEDDMDDVLFES